MKHLKCVSKRPERAFDLANLPVDITFIIDIMNALIGLKQHKAATS